MAAVHDSQPVGPLLGVSITTAVRGCQSSELMPDGLLWMLFEVGSQKVAV